MHTPAAERSVSLARPASSGEENSGVVRTAQSEISRSHPPAATAAAPAAGTQVRGSRIAPDAAAFHACAEGHRRLPAAVLQPHSARQSNAPIQVVTRCPVTLQLSHR